MSLLILLNNFMHDFSAAGWIYGGLALYVILQKSSVHEAIDQAVIDVLKIMRLLMCICFFGIVIFGVIRVFAYKNYEWDPGAGNSQVTLLIVKHVFFAIIFLLGYVYYNKAGKFLRKVRSE